MSAWKTRIVHLGLGRFHKAHQLPYYQRLANLENRKDFGVVSFAMRSRAASDRLKALELKYSVTETDNQSLERLEIEAIQNCGLILEDQNLFRGLVIQSSIQYITLTVTEKGYCQRADGRLDFTHPDISHDLSHPESPRSAIGFLVWGLAERMRQLGGPIAVISCDNIRSNGERLKNAVLNYAELIGWNDLTAWLEINATFPSTMVDRIVPAAVQGDDESDISTESFSQWVIEDHFPFARPDWDKVGVQFVKDVIPFEEMKLSILNASHSLIAYLGILHGHQFVHEAILDPNIRAIVDQLMRVEAPTYIDLGKFDVGSYADALIKRFSNTSLEHRLRQIAADGSKKLPERIFRTLEKSYQQRGPRTALISTVAAWLNFIDEQIDKSIEIDDPIESKFKELKQTDGSSWKSNFLTDPEVFGNLAGIPDFRSDVLRVLF